MFISLFLPRCHSHPSSPHPATISASELSLADGRDRPLRRLDPGMTPLPDTAAGLEWSSLVNAAKAYEGRRLPLNPSRSHSLLCSGRIHRGHWSFLFFLAYYILLVPLYCCAQLCLTLCDPMDWSPRGSSVHGILQARVLEWVTISSPRGSSRPRDQTHVYCIGIWVFYHRGTWEAHLAYLSTLPFFFFWSNWAFF